MEGAWTKNTKTLAEPFDSDRHFVDAASWFDLQEKIRYTSYTGGKHNLENFSYLPSVIMNVINGTAEFAQWNYRIMCHPIKKEIPLKYLEPMDDLASRLAHKMNLTRFTQTRAARFHLAAREKGSYYDPELGYGTIQDMGYKFGILDAIMKEIPGKDNYNANISDFAIGDTEPLLDPYVTAPTPLNTAYYHRLFKSNKKGAMGTTVNRRGYADQNLFVAQTTQPQIAGVKLNQCHKTHGIQTCHVYESKYSYAIPLEIIYLTPLHSWNPYNFEFKADNQVAHYPNYTGGLTPETALRGISNKWYYMTPEEFFSGNEINKDKADTVKNTLGVLDRHGNVRKVSASGTRVMLPNIAGVGKLRQRWPIPPIFREGSSVGKELDAVKEMINHMSAFAPYFQEPPTSNAGAAKVLVEDAHFRTGVSTKATVGRHYHEMFVIDADAKDIQNGHTMKVQYNTI